MVSDELQQAIAWFESRMSGTTMPDARKMLGVALSALREKQERDNPQPLTLDELREMDGQPVWVKYRAQVKFGEPWGVVEEWMIVGAKVQFLRGMNRSVPFEKLSPSESIAYRYKPKEAQDER